MNGVTKNEAMNRALDNAARAARTLRFGTFTTELSAEQSAIELRYFDERETLRIGADGTMYPEHPHRPASMGVRVATFRFLI